MTENRNQKSIKNNEDNQSENVEEQEELKQQDVCEDKLKEMEDKFLKLQLQYKQLYDEYSLFRQRAQNREEEVYMASFEKNVKLVIRIIEDLYKAVSQMPQEIKKSTWGEGLEKLIQQFEKRLNDLEVQIENAIGKEVDHIYHEPIGVEKVEDESQKGKVIKQYERGYIYKKGTDKEKVIQPAKVIVGQ